MTIVTNITIQTKSNGFPTNQLPEIILQDWQHSLMDPKAHLGNF